jgi:hypothetical protein
LAVGVTRPLPPDTGQVPHLPASILDWDLVTGIDDNSVNGHFAGFKFQAKLGLKGLEYSGGVVVARVRGSGGEFIRAPCEGKREIVSAV